jgi:mono/diheme cytochrome c family protein
MCGMHRPVIAPVVVVLAALTLAIPSVLVSAAAPPDAPKAPATASSLPAPEHISPEVRKVIKARMGQHGATMNSLFKAVSLLDRPTIRVLSLRIADEEAVARKQQQPLLPAAFFAEQDKLAASARQLAAAAAEGGDDKVLADRFAVVAQTCVRCHSAYLHDKPEPPPADAKGKAAAPAK